MKIRHIDHVSINFDDLPAAQAFFLDLGLELAGEDELKASGWTRCSGCSMSKPPLSLWDPRRPESLELVKYYTPADETGIQRPLPNTLGIRHIAFVVEDIEAIVAKLKKARREFFSPIYNYEDTYKLCYIRGPEGIILELAEELG